MEMRELGGSSLRTAPIIFGGNVLGWTVDRESAFRILDAFVGAGFNAIDTANTYSRWVAGNQGGESEAIIGDWLQARGRRIDVLIFTKVGHEMGPNRQGLSRSQIRNEIEGSLKRLKTDYVDLYQSHRDDPTVPMAETLQTYADLIKDGKVRAIGASNVTAGRLLEALSESRRLNLPRYEVLQPRFNLYERNEYEGDLERLCLKEKLGVIPFYPLASGFLTGKYRSAADFSKSPRGGRMASFLNAKGLRILQTLDSVARIHGVRPAAVALAWLIARPSITAPIASVTSIEQLEDFTAAVNLRLSAGDIAALDDAGKTEPLAVVEG